MGLNMRIEIKKLLLVGVILLIIGLSAGLFPTQKIEAPSGAPMLTLVKPAWAYAAGSSLTFLDEEAGISLYTNVNQTLNLTKAKSVYRTVEKETSDYIIGSIALPNLPQSDDVHCFIHKNGWIVVYYLKSEPTSKIIDWQYYTGAKLSKDKLQAGLEKVCYVLGVTANNSNYYHFQCPQANKILIIIDSQKGSGSNTFTYTIPAECNIFEGSWSHYASNGRINYGLLALSALQVNVRHTVKIDISWAGWGYYDSHFFVDEKSLSTISSGGSIDSLGAIVFVYNEP